jgi:hypothetical protein
MNRHGSALIGNETQEKSMTGVAVKAAPHPIAQEQRQGAWIAGLGLLVLVGLAGAANARLGQLVAAGDATGTAARIAADQQQFRLIVAGFLLTAVIDVVVAWGLYLVLAPVSRGLAVLSAWLCVAYGAAFVALLANLLAAARLVDGAGSGGVRPALASGGTGQVLDAVTTFQDGWTVSMAVFGLHLLVVGLLAIRASYVPTWLGVLVAVSGLGYLVDGFGAVLQAGYHLGLARFTFVGEILLMIWLLWRGRRLPDPLPARTPQAGANAVSAGTTH